jgi:hypothetical protein
MNLPAVGRKRFPVPSTALDYLVISCVTVLAVALALLGLVERIWMVNRLSISSDQAVVGLMAKRILQGHFVAFYWGQHYGGAEPYLTSVLFALFGSSDTTLNITPAVLSFTAACIVYRIGRYYVPRVFAALAALAIWVWPTIIIFYSTHEYGFRFACLNFGLLAVLFATRIRLRSSTFVNWAILGLSIGVCIWACPDGVYFLVPCAFLIAPTAVLGWRSDRLGTVSKLAGSAACILVGGGPFWWATVTTHFATISQTGAPYPGTFETRAAAMLTHAVPIATGLQRPSSGTWFGGPVLGITALVLSLTVVVGGVVWAVARHRPRTVMTLVAFVVGYLVLYPIARPTFFWQDGRYIVYLPFLFIIVCMYPFGLVPWRRVAIMVATVAVSAMACVTVLELPIVAANFSVSQLTHAFEVKRTSASSLAVALERHHILRGYADYWLAYKVDFESDGSLIYTPIPTDVMRNSADLDAVDTAIHPAWIVCQPANIAACESATVTPVVNPPGLTWTSLTSWLNHQRISYKSTMMNGFTVIVPAARITPAILYKAGVLPS